MRIKTNPDNTTDNILKYEASINWSMFQILFFLLTLRLTFASVLPYLGMISSALPLSNFKPFLKKVWTVALQKRNINKSDCLH